MKNLSAQSNQQITIKPSLVPFAWKGMVVLLLGVLVSVGSYTFRFPTFTISSLLLRLVALALVFIGFLGILVGAFRRNTFTYLITDTDLVLKKQLLRSSVRRIPFSSISDVQVSQTIVGRLAGYGNVVPVTKSGYGLVSGVQPGENIVAHLIDVPKPGQVADLIMSRLHASTST